MFGGRQDFIKIGEISNFQKFEFDGWTQALEEFFAFALVNTIGSVMGVSAFYTSGKTIGEDGDGFVGLLGHVDQFGSG